MPEYCQIGWKFERGRDSLAVHEQGRATLCAVVSFSEVTLRRAQNCHKNLGMIYSALILFSLQGYREMGHPDFSIQRYSKQRD
jgi:hypothetical protein